LELVFGLEPPRSAAEMGADRGESIKPLRLADDPYAVVILVLLADFPHDVILRKPCLEGRRGFIEDPWEHHPERSDRGGGEEHEKGRPARHGKEVAAADAPDAKIDLGRF